MEFSKKIDFDYQFIDGNIYLKNSVCFRNHIELIIHIASAYEEEHIYEMYGAKLISQIDLESHIESVHEGKKQHNCKKCNAGFVNKIDFGNHVASVHDGKSNRTVVDVVLLL